MYGSRLVPGNKNFIWWPPLSYLAVAVQSSGGRKIKFSIFFLFAHVLGGSIENKSWILNFLCTSNHSLYKAKHHGKNNKPVDNWKMQGRGRSNLCQIQIALCYNKTIFKSNQIKRYIFCYAIVYTISIYFKGLNMYKIEKYVFKLRSKRFFFECLWFLEFIIHDAKLRNRWWINFYYYALIIQCDFCM